MIKNLVVMRVPKTDVALSKLLLKLGDHTWSKEGIEAWVKNPQSTCIWYCEKYDSYMAGNKVVYDSKHVYKTYSQIVLEHGE